MKEQEALVQKFEELKKAELEAVSAIHAQGVELQKLRFTIAEVTRQLLGAGAGMSW